MPGLPEAAFAFAFGHAGDTRRSRRIGERVTNDLVEDGVPPLGLATFGKHR
jgi:hypothetical protein